VVMSTCWLSTVDWSWTRFAAYVCGEPGSKLSRGIFLWHPAVVSSVVNTPDMFTEIYRSSAENCSAVDY